MYKILVEYQPEKGDQFPTPETFTFKNFTAAKEFLNRQLKKKSVKTARMMEK